MTGSSPSVLITGGCGFIGVNLGAHLASRGFRLVAFDNLSSGSTEDAVAAGYDAVIEGDIRDEAALERAVHGCKYVVHLAALTSVVESLRDPHECLQVNVGGTLNVLSAARKAGVEGFVFASSNAPVGEVEPPVHEGLVPRPVSPYGASKLAGEGLCSAFSGSFGFPTTILRFSNVYGPYSYHKGSVVATFFKRLLHQQGLIIYGDGKQTRDFIFVEDLCEGIASAMESGLEGETLHLGTGVETRIEDLAEMVLDTSRDRSVPITYEPERPGEIKRNYSDISKARALLGFEPTVTLDTGLSRTYDWFKRAYE